MSNQRPGTAIARVVGGLTLVLSGFGFFALYEHYTPLLLSCLSGVIGSIGLLLLRRWGAVVLCLAAWSLMPLLIVWPGFLSLGDGSIDRSSRVDIGFGAASIGSVSITVITVILWRV